MEKVRFRHKTFILLSLFGVLVCCLVSGTVPAAKQANSVLQKYIRHEEALDDPDVGKASDLSDPIRSYDNPPSSIPIAIGQTKYGAFQNVATPIVYSLYSNQIQVIRLNYSGISAAFRLYRINHYSSADALMNVANIASSNQLVCLDVGITYYLEFQTSIAGIHSFSLSPELIGDSLTDREQYVVHLQDASGSAFGSTISVEKYDLSLTSSTETPSQIYTSGMLTCSDELSSTLHFNYDINVDTRQVITNTAFNYISSVALSENEKLYQDKFGLDFGSNYGGAASSASFVSEDIVVTCAHTFLGHTEYDSDNDGDKDFHISTLSMKNHLFYPGASNYGQTNSSNYHSQFGTYRASHTYLPLSYILAHSAGTSLSTTGNDWAICLTEQTEVGSLPHSYFGLYTPSQSSYSNAQEMGYPGLQAVPDSYRRRWMWSTVPFANTISTHAIETDVFESTTLFTNPGSSGSPVFIYNAYIQNGQLIQKARQIGVHSAGSSSGKVYPIEFLGSFKAKVNHFMVNLLREIGGFNDE